MICHWCKNEIQNKRNMMFCNRSCKAKEKASRQGGQNNPNWNGGRKIGSHGYAMILTRTGYELEHRLLMEHYLGRPLEDWEHVHHKNENKLDNSRENLELTTQSEHQSYHRLIKPRSRDEKGRFANGKR